MRRCAGFAMIPSFMHRISSNGGAKWTDPSPQPPWPLNTQPLRGLTGFHLSPLKKALKTHSESLYNPKGALKGGKGAFGSLC